MYRVKNPKGLAYKMREAARNLGKTKVLRKKKSPKYTPKYIGGKGDEDMVISRKFL